MTRLVNPRYGPTCAAIRLRFVKMRGENVGKIAQKLA